MKEVDFTECKFIKEQLRFLFFKDFCKDCFIIKRAYGKLSNDGKIFYKWYLYSHINIDLNKKNIIWSFLNDDITYEELVK